MVEDNIDFTKFKYCECGCKQLMLIKDKKGRYRKYIRGHSVRITRNSWKGGRRKDIQSGYIRLFMPDYFSSNKNGVVYEHVYIFQEYYKCCMLPWGIVHHIIPVKEGGTNDISNLQGMTHSQHITLHNSGNKYGKKDMSDRKCSNCGSTETYIDKKTNRPNWRYHNDNLLCKKCWSKNYKLKNKINY